MFDIMVVTELLVVCHVAVVSNRRRAITYIIAQKAVPFTGNNRV